MFQKISWHVDVVCEYNQEIVQPRIHNADSSLVQFDQLRLEIIIW